MAKAGSSDSRDFRWSSGPPMHMVTSPLMGLQISTRIHTRRIEEERGKKNRDKSQGTLTLGLGHHGGCTLKEGKKTEENKIRRPQNKSLSTSASTNGIPTTEPRKKSRVQAVERGGEAESADRTPVA